MKQQASPALTPEQWDTRDYRQAARDLDRWAQAQAGGAEDDTTEYVAKLGLSSRGSVIVMNRAHDRVLVPPPARPALAAFALLEQPFGFTAGDVGAVQHAAEQTADARERATLQDLAHRLEALLPPAESR
ncbi:MAG TPA: hypothetical protein VJQ46_06110 [Gemmatimonadales bacterium]|nr:hypothetical protein [Gemmatimonadales bacterium]